jgi:MYXO-CTERM domain-containing protein
MIPAAGLGVLAADGSFLIPTLFLVVDAGTGPLDLAIPDLEGQLDFDDPALLRLETSFAVDTLGPDGIVTVTVVATPEPGPALLALLALAALGATRARRGLPR